MSSGTTKKFAIAAAVVLLLALVGGFFLNREWQKVKTEYGISYRYLHIGLSGTLSAAGFQFKNEDIGEGTLDTAYLDVDLLKLIKGQISISDILVDGGNISILASQSESETELPSIYASRIHVNNLNFSYIDSDTLFKMFSGILHLREISFDDSLSVDTLNWTQAAVQIHSSNTENEADLNDTATFDLNDIPGFQINYLDLSDLSFAYISDSSNLEINQFTFAEAHVSKHQQLTLQFDTLSFNLADTLPLGLAIANTRWAQRDAIKSEQLKLGIPGIKLRVANVSVQPSGKYPFALNLDESQISYATLYMLDIGLEDIFNQNLDPGDVITLSGNIAGDADHVDLEGLNASLLNQTHLLVNGSVDWSTDQGMLDLHVANIFTTGSDIRKLLEPMAYNDFFSWPTKAHGPVSITGDFENYLIQGKLNTSQGLLDITSVINFPSEQDLFYSISVGSDRALIDGLVEYLPIDISQAKVQIDIGGLLSDVETRDTFLMDLHFYDFTAEGYDLKNLTFDYYYNNKYDSLWVILDDPALQANMKGAVLGGDTGSVPFAVNIAKAAPGLLDSIIPAWAYSGNLNGAYRYAGEDYFEILLAFSENNMLWENSKKPEPLDNFSLDVKAKKDRYNLDFNVSSDNYLNTTFYMPDYNYDKISVFQILDSMPEFTIQSRLNIDSTFAQNLIDIPIALNLENLDINHSKVNESWQLSANVSQLSYEDISTENFNLHLLTSPDTLDAYIDAATVSYSEFDLTQLFAKVDRHDKSFVWQASIADVEGLGATNIQTRQSITDDGYLFNFIETDTLLIAGHPWTVSDNRGINFTTDYKLNGGNLAIQQGSAKIALETDEQELMNFQLDSISLSSLIEPFLSDVEFQGYLNSQVQYTIPTGKAELTASASEVAIDSLDIGKWDISGSYFQNTAKASIVSKSLDGGFRSTINYDNSGIDYFLLFENFNLSFLNNALQDVDLGISGLLNGELKGTYKDELDTKGWLQVNKGSFEIPYLLTSVSLDRDSLYFEDKKLVFRKFKITDPNGQKLYVDGILDVLPDLVFDLDVISDNYTFLNQDRGKVISGKASASVKLDLIGTPENASVTGKLKILPGSFVRYVLPDDVTAANRGGDLIFVSFDEVDTIKVLKGTTSQNLNMDVDFELDKTNFELVINPVTQEYVKFEAGGNLTLSKTGTDAPAVFGEISSETGRSRIDLPIVPAVNLDIKKASLKWHGPYDDPIITFIGTEDFKSTVSELPSLEHRTDIVPVTLEIQLNQVTVNTLDFDFDLSSSDPELDSYLKAQTPENRQNMATNLLLFGTLSYGGEDGADKMLNNYTSKLNEIANRNLVNTDLFFSVDNQKTYNQAGEEVTTTKLNYNLRRGFYNDRVFFSLGGDFGLANTDPSASSTSSHFIGNVGIDYVLFPDGPWTLKAARNERYEGIIDGDIVEYKLGIGFYRSYPTFWSIFNQEATKPKEEEEVSDEK